MTLLLPYIRHALQFVAGALVLHGWIDHNSVEPIVGIGMSITTLVWFEIERRRNRT